MEIRNFISFKQIVELGSFTKASQTLGYAQSTITTHINQIEDYLGQDVFERLGHTIILTDIGKELLIQVNQLLPIYKKIEDLSDLDSSRQITIRIGAEETILLYKLKNLFKDFKSLCPEIEIILINESYNELKNRLLDGSADIIFVIDKLIKQKDFIVTVIDEEQMIFVNSPDYQEKRKKNIFRTPKIILTRKGGTYSSIFENYLSNKHIVHDVVMEAWSIELVKQSLILGMGVSFLPKISVNSELNDGILIGDLVKLPSKNKVYSQMIYHKNKQLNKSLLTLINLVNEYKN